MNKNVVKSKNDNKSEIKTIINPFYVFSGTIHPSQFVDIQIDLLDQLGPEDYFNTQLKVIHASISQLISELISERSDEFQSNVNFIGHA